MKRNSKAILLELVTIMVALGCITVTEAAAKAANLDLGLISLSDTSDMCQYSIPSSYSCCQSVTVNMLNDTKKLCLTINADLLSGALDLTATMDGVSVGKFNLNVAQPPSACLPLISMSGLNMCVKFIFTLSTSGAKICPNVAASYNANDIMTYAFPCAQVGLSGVNLV